MTGTRRIPIDVLGKINVRLNGTSPDHGTSVSHFFLSLPLKCLFTTSYR